MNNLLILSSYLLLVVSLVCGDLYMHNMRGSNNRLNEPRATRKENNRLFNSQNNARGGYNVGDRGSEAATDESGQYQMKYFQSSASANTHLKLEWTVQHGFGTNDKLNSNFVIQMMCQRVKESEEEEAKEDPDRLRDGFSTDKQPFQKKTRESYTEYLARKNSTVQMDRGLHENFYWYDQCSKRPRNRGLFTAGQIKDNRRDARFTRQNPNGGRSGYECPEERDYYPYWAPNPWKDVAVLTSKLSDCSKYKTESFNTASKGECVELYDDDAKIPKTFFPEHNETECNEKGLQWVVINNYLEILDAATEAACTAKGEELVTAVKWGKAIHNYVEDVCFVPLLKPICKEGEFSRVNHNGNSKGLKMLSYDWKVPRFPSGDKQRCVLRMRYNITTNDYDPSTTFADTVPDYFSYTEDNPKVTIGKDEDGNNITVQVNVNLEQFGRTFQDRSHVFCLEKRPDELNDIKIHNLNVRGKRGNIVQVYPAVEYDFTPNALQMKATEGLHIQWTGSNTHNNGNPGGDGQTGDAGQGKTGSDRNNMLCLDNLNHNFPMPFDSSKGDICMFNKIYKVLWHYNNTNLSNEDMAISAATSGYANSNNDLEDLEEVNEDLDDAPASFPGAVIQFHAGNYFYMCTRNNAFTNRSQKGRLNVKN